MGREELMGCGEIGNKEVCIYVFCAHVGRTISFSRILRSPTVFNFLFSIAAENKNQHIRTQKQPIVMSSDY